MPRRSRCPGPRLRARPRPEAEPLRCRCNPGCRSGERACGRESDRAETSRSSRQSQRDRELVFFLLFVRQTREHLRAPLGRDHYKIGRHRHTGSAPRGLPGSRRGQGPPEPRQQPAAPAGGVAPSAQSLCGQGRPALREADVPAPSLEHQVLPARQMLLEAEAAGKLEGVDALIESSSGNTAFSLGILAELFGVRSVVAMVPWDIAPGKLDLLRLERRRAEADAGDFRPAERDRSGARGRPAAGMVQPFAVRERGQPGRVREMDRYRRSGPRPRGSSRFSPPASGPRARSSARADTSAGRSPG